MIVKKITVGPLEENCYIVGDESSKQAIVIDPGDEPDRVLEIIESEHFTVTAIVCTHAHFDHIGAVGELKKSTGAQVLIHREDGELYERAKDQAAIWGFDFDETPKPDGYLDENDTVKVGNLTFTVLHTPGHSPGGICLYGEGLVITGDTLFQGSVGRTDMHGGNAKKLQASFKRLLDLPEDTIVLSGHGPESTIGRERSDNFFVHEWL